MSQDYLDKLAEDGGDVGFQAVRVMLHMLGRMDYQNDILVSTGAVAQKLRMPSQNVSRAIRRLVETGIILRGEKLGSLQGYKLNPEIGWKGSGKNHMLALRECGKAA